ncbi:MAG: hypothetical protein JRJ49_06050 [Deltaproteobacteria bacterium]|nr:hypothetical protein [Deltaproteobacteria bacterium]
MKLRQKVNTKKIILILSFIIALTVSISFLPSLNNGFVNWDDNAYLTENPDVFGVSVENIKKIFTKSYNASYVPLTLLSFAIEYEFVGLNPFLYHLNNLILQIANALLIFLFFYIICRKYSWSGLNLSGALTVSFLTALFFGIHPTRVDSVAWVTERKDLLYTFFYFASLILYHYFNSKSKKESLYILSLFLFTLSLLAKPMAVTLPVILLLLDFVEKNKITASMIIEKIPFFILSLAFGIINMKVHIAAEQTGEGHFLFLDVNIFKYVLYTAENIFFYISKCFFPIKLTPIYDINHIIFANKVSLYPFILLILWFAFLILYRKKNKKILFGSLFFLITIAPVLQIIPQGTVPVAERFAYVPMLGIFFMTASGINYILQKYQYKFVTYSLIITITAVIACLSVMTWKQCKIWKNTLTLWNHAVNINPEYPSGTALFFRAGAYHRAGELDKALADYNVLVGRIKNAAGTEIDENAKYHDQKNLVRILSARGSLYYQNGNLGKAAEDYTSLLEISDVNPIKKAEVFYKRAVVYYSMKQSDKAVSDILKVIDITPYNDRLYEFIGIIRASQKDYKTAYKYFEKALSINPANKSSYYYLEQINKINIAN